MRTVYLLDFERPVPNGKTRHYAGITGNLTERLAEHRAGNSGPIFRILRDWNIHIEVARIWEFSDIQEAYDMERWLKEMRKLPRYCPICTERPWRTSNAHLGACERYADVLEQRRYLTQRYRELQLGGLEHRRIHEILRQERMARR